MSWREVQIGDRRVQTTLICSNPRLPKINRLNICKYISFKDTSSLNRSRSLLYQERSDPGHSRCVRALMLPAPWCPCGGSCASPAASGRWRCSCSASSCSCPRWSRAGTWCAPLARRCACSPGSSRGKCATGRRSLGCLWWRQQGGGCFNPSAALFLSCTCIIT